MKRTRSVGAPWRVLFAGALAFAVARCGADELTGAGVNPDDVSFSLEGDSVVVLGDGLDIRAVLPKRRAAGPYHVAWSSADPDVVSVDSTGYAHGLRVGRTEIEARLSAPELTDDVVRALSLRVGYAALAVVAPDSLTGLGETRTLVAHGVDAAGTPESVVPATFATDDSDVVTVTAAGVVTARADGTATVTASHDGIQAPVTVRVRRVASRIAFASSQLLLTALERDTTVVVIVRDTEDSIMAAPALAWESSDPTAVTVTAEGVIRALRSAPATVTVTSDTVSAELPVLVGQEAASLSVFGGNNQQAEVGTSVAVAPAVIARDAGGSPLADVLVVFSVAGGDGTIEDSVQVTDASGVARLGSWTLGTTAGVNALSAGAGPHSLAFTATGVAAPADAGESFITVSSNIVVANQSITVTLHGRDRYGNDVSAGGANVAFSASGGTSTGVLGTVVDQGDGDYTATFTGVVAGTATSIGATLDGDPVAAPAPSVTVVPGPPTQIGVVTGDGQTAAVATAVGVRPDVLVRDALNNPVPGVTVTFAVTDGGGGVTGSSVATNAAGRAAVGSWTLGTIVGANELTASIGGGISTTFGATGVPGPASATTSTVDVSVATLTAGDDATVTLTTRDQYGNLRTTGGHTVAVTISGGGSGGTFGPVTDHGDGTYSATFTAVTAGSPSSVGATIEGVALTTTLPTVEVEHGAPAAMVIASGDGQAAPVATAVPAPPTVRVEDAYGNAVPGVAVTFAVDLGGGQLTGGAGVTNATGNAAPASWELGTVVGTNTLDATAGALAVEFTATAIPGPPAAMIVVSGNGQSAPVATAVPMAPTVRVDDAYGNVVPGVVVTFTVDLGGGQITGGAPATNASGHASPASWQLGTVVGTNTLDAAAGVLAVEFSATGTPGPPAAMTITSGNGQTAPVATAVPIAPTVRVDDAFGNAVPGVAVAFTVDLGGGQITGGAPVTNATGHASPASWQLGTIVGTNTLDAAAGALAVEFSATGTPGPASTATSEVTAPASAPSGSQSTVTLRVRDQYGNDITTGGLTTVTFTASAGSMSAATDNGDGTYTATFTAPLVLVIPMDVTIRAFIGGVQVTDTAVITVTLL